MPTSAVSPAIRDIIDFWLASAKHWFVKSADFDGRFKTQFELLHWQAARRAHDLWASSDEGALALLILLDQYPRNCFRNTGHMYATDPLARHYARLVTERKGDLNLEPSLRVFCYLPFTHSEDPLDQDLAVQLNERGETGEGLKFALHHRDIIKRYGRFPHRNAILARRSTQDELRFLEEGGFSG
ncbi:DUF924 family protein [Paenalcaligenes niemegkensis]|uniref:DUF924 family protein n=1 Tax=Paenalcaligenes niemegkensis TaxID=2895469 RepID=UPI001EE8286E|nr:DUF924 family protein [Paenalcaligenes niemegkensis]MCQ9617846.1 DUF924 family protein [Paenalcaligenes niemegkensis]